MTEEQHTDRIAAWAIFLLALSAFILTLVGVTVVLVELVG